MTRRVGRAGTDALTGLADRGRLERRARRLLTGERHGDPTRRAVLIVDLDHFKHVNDTLGHAAGDAVLVEVAARLERAARPGALVARLGGDEFLVLSAALPPGDDGSSLAGAVRRSLVPPVRVDGVGLRVGASVGVALEGRDGHDLVELMRVADRAMYADKARPGAPAREEAAADPTLGPDLRAALERRDGSGALGLHHQPQVGWDGTVNGYEALLRWSHPRRGLLLPRDVLPVARAEGALTALTLHAVARALTDHAALAAAARPADPPTGLAPDAPTVSVNVAARDLLVDGFVDDVASLLAAASAPPGCLLLEIAEPAPHPRPAVQALFAALDALGVGVSIHEFGAGAASLAPLAGYAGVRELKLDPALTRAVATDPAAARLVAATVGAAHALDLAVVAEGVEDPGVVPRLRDLGCDRLQGFLVAAPLPPDEVAAWLDRWRAGGRPQALLGA